MIGSPVSTIERRRCGALEAVLIFVAVAGICAAIVLRLAWLAHRDNDADREDDVLDRQIAAARSRLSLAREAIEPSSRGSTATLRRAIRAGDRRRAGYSRLATPGA
jgi:hypothetical protein